ncbi:TRAP transporter small permease subunit [Desulfogranum marinum]|jgi:TRAP-type C4-dicarboxylate transport system permease small subunit|uniref:TRAP transporter small permease subunit n=1 Tax=Desulfogranum marinum TaxID=453220 RepID=UPI001963255B|nr:TRAP transporter small permease subunit [Desulfogranum marinum]MBM9512192.1 TRAP transporter small permease subunit [Desulfogranum marinum]
MKKLIAIIESISRAGGYVSGLFMILIVLLIVVEIVARTVFNASTLISDEYSAYFFVAVVMSGLAFSMKEGAHIRISIVRSRLSQEGQRILDLLVLLIALVLSCFALYHSVLMTYDVWDLGMTADSISETPIFIPQLVIPVGLLLFILQLASGFLRRLLSFPTR